MAETTTIVRCFIKYWILLFSRLPYRWNALAVAVSLTLLAILSLFILEPGSIALAASDSGNSPTCRLLDGFVGSQRDAAPALTACFAATAPNREVALNPGRYVLRSRVVIQSPIYLHTAGVSSSSQRCQPHGDGRCATLVLIPNTISPALPFAVLADGTHIDHVVFQGSRVANPAAGRAACTSPTGKPSGGGLQISGSRIIISLSVFELFPCYSALEFGNGSHTNFVGNTFANNGAHDASLSWADGLTIHDGRSLTVSGNQFTDNTDVQLIFGGCQACVVKGNVFRHSGAVIGGSFADLMMHAWPNGATSGNFTGTMVTENDIDCSDAKRCGFGLMIGATPWYAAPTFGGTVKGNKIVNAMLAININDLTGPMVIRDNRVSASGGDFPTTCGPRSETAVNVSPLSRRYVEHVSNIIAGGKNGRPDAVTFGGGCLLNHPLVAK